MIAVIALVAAFTAAPAFGKGGKPVNVPNPKTTAIIDYIDAKPDKPGKPGKRGGGTGPDHSAGHFELIGGVWADANPNTTPIDPNLAFVVDIRGFPVGSSQAILDSFAAWEAETAGNLFNEVGTAFANVTVDFGDGVNTYSMRNLGGRVLAATFITWNDSNDNGKIDAGETYLEMDVVHNSTVSWATDATAANTKGKWWDVQNVAIHENGHVFGLDHPGDAHDEDKVQTMFASAPPKETSKRTLEANGDIPGIQSGGLGYGAAP